MKETKNQGKFDGENSKCLSRAEVEATVFSTKTREFECIANDERLFEHSWVILDLFYTYGFLFFIRLIVIKLAFIHALKPGLSRNA